MEKPILIIAAMEDVEIDYLKTKLKNIKEAEYRSFKFFEGQIFSKDVVICVSNIGLINAAVALTIAIEKYSPCMVINVGVAGGYTENTHKGDIVIVEKAMNITSLEGKREGNKIEDYDITTFLHNEENRVIMQKANERLINYIKNKFKGYNLHFRNYCQWRYLE